MMYARDFRRQAYNALNANIAVAVGTWIVAMLLGAQTSSFQFPNFNWTRNLDDYDPNFWKIFFIILAFALSYGVVLFIIGGAITLGYAKFNLNLINRTNPRFTDIFSKFDMFGTGFLMRFFMGLFTFLWTLLLIVPGIIAALSYAMTPYILLENPNMSALDAITRSKEMMYGNKGRLFCLYLSFIGWYLLSILTCGLLYLWLGPYISAATAAFYNEVSGKNGFYNQNIYGYNNPGYNNSGYNNPGINYIGYNNSGYNNSGYNPGYNNPGYNNPGYNNPGYNNPGINNSGYSNPGNNNPGYSNSGYSNPGNNNPGYNNSGYSNPGNNYSDYNNTGSNNPGHNNPGYNNSGNYYPGYNNSVYNTPGYNNPGNNISGNNIPGYNNPGYNNTGYYNPSNNTPGYINSGYNNPGYNNSGYNNTGVNGNNISNNTVFNSTDLSNANTNVTQDNQPSKNDSDSKE